MPACVAGCWLAAVSAPAEYHVEQKPAAQGDTVQVDQLFDTSWRQGHLDEVHLENIISSACIGCFSQMPNAECEAAESQTATKLFCITTTAHCAGATQECGHTHSALYTLAFLSCL